MENDRKTENKLGTQIKMKPLFLLLVCVVLVLVSGCLSTDSPVEVKVVKEGDYVLVDYTGKLEDGTVFD